MRFPYLTPSQIQSRLLTLAAGFILVLGVALTISPAAREQSWQVDYRLNHWIGIAVWLVLIITAHWQITKHMPDTDPYLLPVASLLTGWGMLSIWRLTSEFGFRQSLWIAVCFAVLLIGLRRGEILEFLRRYKYVWLTSGLLLTALTFFLGANPIGYGPRLWLGCCGVYFQPSEPLKLLLVVYLAAYFAGRMPLSGRILHLLLPTLLLTGIALAILVIQRDLGTASIFVFLYAVMVYQASAKRRILLLSILLLTGLGMAGYFFIDIIQYRLQTWFNPWQDPSGQSYQIVQSLLAIANGGLFGRGIGLGSPGIIPVAHSDFIYSAIAEETGLVGSLALFTLIGILITRSYIIALRAESHFERLLAAGLGAYLGAQSLVILGGNLRMLPLTGVTLPFVSYGGSSLLTSFLALLLLIQISNAGESDPAPLVRPAPYLVMPALLCTGLITLTLASGWWSIVRAADLLARYDNPRRSIADRYVLRGTLFDRRNTPISYSDGSPGSYYRVYAYPELSATVGYTHSTYGQAGLEAQLDAYLRGLSGYPASQIWWQHLLNGYPPPGLDVRLSLDLSLQEQADRLLGNAKGALVLVNAETGEILAMASHPNFDANQLDEIGAQLPSTPDAPLFNRASLGQYTTGTALAPFLLAELFDARLEMPIFPASLLIQQDGQLIRCTLRNEQAPDWDNALPAGCPQPLLVLAKTLGVEKITGLLEKLTIGYTTNNLDSLAIGQTVSATPLNLALAASALSNDGVVPTAQLPLAVNIPNQGWVIFPSAGESKTVFSADAASQAAQFLQVEGRPYWESMGRFASRAAPLIWYLGGTLPTWQGTPLAIVVVVETDNPLWARDAGRGVLDFAIQP